MFFGYNPLKWRLGLMFLAVCTVVLAAWAAAGVVLQPACAPGCSAAEVCSGGKCEALPTDCAAQRCPPRYDCDDVTHRCTMSLRDSDLFTVARAGIAFGLLFAILTVLFRLRPREGWGVTLTPTHLTVSRATGGLIETPWSLVREARFVTFERDAYAVFLEEDHRILVARHLFARRADFDAVVKAVDERVPKRGDA